MSDFKIFRKKISQYFYKAQTFKDTIVEFSLAGNIYFFFTFFLHQSE